MHDKPSIKLGIIRILRKLGIIRMYRLVFVSSCFFFIFCKDDSEMLRLLKKIIEFFHDVLQRNVTAASPPTPKQTYDVSRGQNRYVRLPLLEAKPRDGCTLAILLDSQFYSE